MAEAIPLLNAEHWRRQRFGAWVSHAGTLHAERRLAHWLHHGGRLWLNSQAISCGKSHLLHHLATMNPGVLRVLALREQWRDNTVESVRSCLQAWSGCRHWGVDLPAGACEPHIGELLFHLIERAKQQECAIVIAWHCDDALLAPPELASRLRSMEQVRLHPPPDDSALRAILYSVAHNLRWDPPRGVLDVMLTHGERSLSHQLEILHRLERESRPERVRATQRWTRGRVEEMRKRHEGD